MRKRIILTALALIAFTAAGFAAYYAIKFFFGKTETSYDFSLSGESFDRGDIGDDFYNKYTIDNGYLNVFGIRLSYPVAAFIAAVIIAVVVTLIVLIIKGMKKRSKVQRTDGR